MAWAIGHLATLIPKYSQLPHNGKGEVMTIRALMSGMIMTFAILGFAALAYADELSCQFKSQERVDMTIIAGEKTIWSGTLEKAETKTVTIPNGAFTVISKVFNPNLERKGDIRGTAHTNLCKDNRVIAVPLFSSEP
jgi:hypothetical protein